MKNLLYAAGALALLSVAVCAVLFTLHAIPVLDAARTLPDRVTALQLAVERLPREVIPLVTTPVLAEVDKQAGGLRKDLARQADAIRLDVLGPAGQITALRKDTVEIATQLTGQVGQVVAIAAGIRTDLQPTLLNSAALVKDAQDSWDDSYDDVRGLLDSAEVATTQTAQTMEAVRKAAPELADAAVKNTENVAGITADVHKMTTAMLKPKSFLGKIWAGVTVFSRFAGLL